MRDIVFVCPDSPGYKKVLDAIIDPILEHLPEGEKRNKGKPGAINIRFFVECEHEGIFIPHGIADKNYRNANKVTGFDYVFVSGPAWVDKLVKQGYPKDKILVGGYTKLDPIFQDKYKRTLRDKPQILYAPTHGAIKEISLHGRFNECLDRLRQFYDVIESPHPTTTPGKNITMQALIDADVVISDAGSLVYEAWALGKPVVFPSWLIKEGVMRYFPGSLEEQIYREEIGYHAWNETNLLDCVKRAVISGIDSRAAEFIEGIFPVSLRGNSGENTAKLLRSVASV